MKTSNTPEDPLILVATNFRWNGSARRWAKKNGVKLIERTKKKA